MRRFAFYFAAVMMAASGLQANAADFHALGDLDGGVFFSAAAAVSGDGSVVVGASDSTSGREAFRWTADGNMLGLNDLDGGEFPSQAYGVSADGSIVVGFRESAAGREAFRWTEGSGIVGLGELDGGEFLSFAYDISADGSTIVGHSDSATSATTLGIEAFRQTESEGMVGLGSYLPDRDNYARGVSADGSIVTGYAFFPGWEAFRWTAADGMVSLGDLGGVYFASYGTGISSDGSTIIGHCQSASGGEAFRWT